MRSETKIHQGKRGTLSSVFSAGFKKISCLAAVTVISLSTVPLPMTQARVASESAATQDQAIVHLLNRITYGPRPGDIERVKQMGVTAFIDEQLHPERIEDSKITDRVKQFETLGENTQELYAMQPKELVNEFQQAKVLRALYSDRQLNEIMVDFWQNHFNVFVGKGADRFMMTAYDRDTIRPHVMGKFKDSTGSDGGEPRHAVLSG